MLVWERMKKHLETNVLFPLIIIIENLGDWIHNWVVHTQSATLNWVAHIDLC